MTSEELQGSPSGRLATRSVFPLKSGVIRSSVAFSLLVFSLLYLLNYFQRFGDHLKILIPLVAVMVALSMWRFVAALGWFVLWIPYFSPHFVIQEVLLFVLAGLFAVAELRKERVFRPSHLNYAALAFVAIVLLSVLGEIVKLHSLPAPVLRHFVFLGLKNNTFHNQTDYFFCFRSALFVVDGIILCWIVSSSIIEDQDLRRLSGILPITFIPVLIYCGWRILHGRMSVQPLGGIFDDRNAMGAFLLLPLAFLGALSGCSLRWLSSISAVVFALLLVLLGFTLSLGAIFSGLLITIYLPGLFVAKNWNSIFTWSFFRRNLWKFVCGLILLYFFFPTLALLVPSIDPIAWAEALHYRFISLSPAKIQETLGSARGVPWKVAIYAVKANPWFGIGEGTFFRKFSELRESFGIPFTLFQYRHENAHNNFLQIAADLGLPALIIFLTLSFLGILSFRRLYRKSSDRWERPVALGLALGSIGLLVTSLTAHPLLVMQLNLYFWLYLGLADSGGNLPVSRGRHIWAAILFVICLAWIGHLVILARTPTEPFSYGFYTYEKENEPERQYRWTFPVAVDRIPRQGNVVRFFIRTYHPQIESRTVTVRTAVDAANQTILLSTRDWVPIAMPAFGSDPLVNVSFQVNPTWNPKRDAKSTDDRELGVAVSAMEWKTERLFALLAANFYGTEFWAGGEPWSWMRQDGKLHLYNFTERELNGVLSFSAKPLRWPADLAIYEASRPIWKTTLNGTTESYEVSLRLKPGITILLLHSSAEPIAIDSLMKNRDFRTVSVAVGNLRLTPLPSGDSRTGPTS